MRYLSQAGFPLGTGGAGALRPVNGQNFTHKEGCA
jgi:hypothetical protein